jgi:hypothetical protein
MQTTATAATHPPHALHPATALHPAARALGRVVAHLLHARLRGVGAAAIVKDHYVENQDDDDE